jgi:hypothetical protein
MTRKPLKILLVSFAIVSGLAVLERSYGSSVLFYLLYPGNVLGLFITGGHGGTHAENALAAVLGFLANLCAYWLVLNCCAFALNGRAVRALRN